MELVSYNNEQNTLERLPPINNLPGQTAKSNDFETKYTLANNTFSHQLPPSRALKANADHTSGIIDTWPAHSSNQRPTNVQLSLNKQKQLVITDAEAEGKAEITPKPKFLENLEKFLQRELKVLGCANSTTTSESRLQAYREVFEYLLEEFRTYKPLLASIKNEYEMMLAAQREKIRELEPLKQMLVTLADECDHKLMQYREEDKVEIKELKEEKKKLLDMITQLKNEKHSLKIQVEKLQNELSEEHEKLRNEQDKRKLLIMDLNDLRFQQEAEREKKKNENTVNEENKDDPVTLKIALKVCRQNLTDAMKRITNMEADYNDVVPRRDFEALDAKFKKLEAKYGHLKTEMKALKQEQNNSKDTIKQLETKLAELNDEMENARENGTPRPDWDRCANLIDGGVERWRELKMNKSSAQLLEILLDELSASHSGPDTFTGKGHGANVPPHLKVDGKVKNKNLSKKEITNLIIDVLKEKKNNKKDSETMSEFFISYLKKHHPNDAFDYSYSIQSSFEKYPQNELIQFFSGVLTEKVDEELYFYENKVISEFYEGLKKAETENDIISDQKMLEILAKAFPNKNNEQLENLIKTAANELDLSDTSRIAYKDLLGQDDEGRYGQFMIMFKQFLKHERTTLAEQILSNIGSTSSLSQIELKKVINVLDDKISDKYIEKIINWCFRKESQIDSNTLRLRIENGCLYNFPNFKQ